MSQALTYYDAGFTHLVSVVPPNGTVSPKSTLKQEDAGKSPGRKGFHGQYVGYPWLSHVPERHEVHQWVIDGSSIGFGAWAYPAIDVDVTDPDLAKRAVEAVEAIMGPCVIRVGQAPKALLVFRCEMPLRSFDVRYAKYSDLIGAEVAHLVQFLGAGRQYVMDGLHPRTGRPYTVTDPYQALSNLGPAALPLLTLEKLIECFDAIAEVMASGGYNASTDATARTMAAEVKQEDLRAPSLVALEGVVSDLPNTTMERHEYIAVGYAIKAAAQDDEETGREIFRAWCHRWAGGENSDEQIDTDWDKMVPPYRTGYGWLIDRGRDWGVNMAQWTFGAAEQAPEGWAPEDATAGQVATADRPAEPGLDRDFTEISMADEFARLHAGVLATVPELDEACYRWDGKRWVNDSRHSIESEVREYLKRKASRAQMLIESDTKRAEVTHRLLAYRTVQSLTRQVMRTGALAFSVESIHDDPDVIHTPAGPFNLRTGYGLEPDPGMLSLRSTKVAPDLTGHCPRWRQFILESTGGDEELARYLQKLAGYALTGHTSEQVFPFFTGGGGNGKSVFVSTLQHIWGDYACSVPVELFQQRKTGGSNSNQDYYLAKMVGARLALTSETKTGGYWDEQRVKQLTGEDVITARMPYGRPFDFAVQATLIVVGNYAPELDSVGEAMIRRLQIVPWTHTPARVDRDLTTKLKAEAPGILAWAMEGARMWYEERLGTSDAIVRESEAYLVEQDSLGSWMGECVRVTGGYSNCRGFAPTVTTKQLYDSYCRWREMNHGKPMGFYKFGQVLAPRLLSAGARRMRGEEGRGWKGLALLENTDLPPNVHQFTATPPPVAGSGGGA